ncbi:hypothetical protein [Natrinema sp. 1APR25-10V2]|uniref:hypothetical protein n=1 Tax=Natrinema sp. 1APR25-10V2 TaxID=2951081 RepID=UPI0028769746|nr:hypothetical protein [Natrinema sp. 1APR25-10V2]MDS0476525.1 hypothetical protein [Natrinema sp. 1APR25-10V2]
MTHKLNIGRVLRYGFDRVTTRGGAMLLGAYVLFQLANQVGFQSLVFGLLAETVSEDQLSQGYPLAVDMPTTVSAGLIVLLMIAGLALGVVTMRAIYADIDSLPTADHTRRLGRTVGVAFVVMVITTLAVMIAMPFFLLPGIYVGISLMFAYIVVAIEDAGVVESLERSWELASGNRLELFGLGFVLVVVGGMTGALVAIVGLFVPVVSILGLPIAIGVLSVYSVAVQVGAYRQLAGESETTSSAASW